MPLDPTTGSAPARPVIKIRKPDEGTRGPQPVALPTEKPVPILQNYGVQLPIREINDRVEQITLAHRKKFGTNPSPGLLRDLILAPVASDRKVSGMPTYDKLFELPKSKREAQAFRTASKAIAVEEEGARSDLQVVKDAIWAYADLTLEDKGRAALGADPTRLREAFRRNPRLEAIYRNETSKTRMMQAGFGSVPMSTVGKYVKRAIGQIAGSIVDMPYGLYKMGEAVALDTKDNLDPRKITKGQVPTPSPFGKRSEEIAKAMAVQTYEDFRHPLRNPGYLLMDVWAGVTAGAGIGTRLGAVSKAAKGEKWDAFKKRPVPGTVEMGWGDYTAHLPLFENAAARLIQKPYLERRNRKMMEREAAGVTERNYLVYDEIFSTERKVAKEIAREAEIHFGETVAPLLEYIRMGRWDTRAKEVMKQFASGHPGEWKSLATKEKFALNWAAKLSLTSDFDPAGAWRAFHEREIAKAEAKLDEDDLALKDQHEATYTIRAHKAQLKGLELGQEMLLNPTSRLAPFIQRTLDVSKAQENLKIELGLSREIAEQAPAKTAAILRDETLIDMGDGMKAISRSGNPEAAMKTIKEKTKTIAKITAEIASAQKKLAKRPNSKPLAALVKRREGYLKNHQAALEKANLELDAIRKSAEPLKRIPGPAKVHEVTVTKSAMNNSSRAYPHDLDRTAIIYSVPENKMLKQSADSMSGIAHADLRNTWKKETGEVLGGTAEWKPGQPQPLISVQVFPKKERKNEFEQVHDAGVFIDSELSRVPDALIHSLREQYPHLDVYVFGENLGDSSFVKVPDDVGANAPREVGYYPSKRQFKTRKRLGVIGKPLKRSTKGVAPPRMPDTIMHTLEGDAMRAGDARSDIQALLTEESVAVFRATAMHKQWSDLWDISRAEYREGDPYQMPIRDIKTAPKKLRQVAEMMLANKLDSTQAELMKDPALRELREFLYPGKDVIDELLKNDEHIRFVDERRMLDKVWGKEIGHWEQIESVFASVMTPINEPARLVLVYGTPAYLLNAGGNAMLALVHQGPLAVKNTVKGVRAEKLYGRQGADIIDSLGGETLTSALVSEQNMFTKGSQGLAKFWQQITDVMFRRAAVIYELERRGVLKKDMTPEEATAALKSVDNEAARIESARYARKAMLDFNSMSWPERATLRHLTFLYTFMRASAMYGGNFLVEHPIIGGVAAQSGRTREDDLFGMIGESPEWFKRHGYFPGFAGRTVDPIQFWVPSMLTEMAYPLAALVTPVAYSSPAEQVSPGYKFWTRMVTGKDEQGRDLGESGTIPDTLMSLVRETPVGFMRKRGQREAEETPLPKPAVRSGTMSPFDSAMGRENAALDHGSFEGDGFWNQWGRVIGRSAIPLDIEKEALNARYWRDMRDNDPKKYVEHQIVKTNQMIGRQEKVLSEKAPQGVRDAVELVGRIALRLEEWRKALHTPEGKPWKNPSAKVVALETVDILQEMGKIDAVRAKELRAFVNSAKGPQASSQARLAVLYENGGKSWMDWNKRVNAVMAYDTPEFKFALEDAAKEGMGRYTGADASRQQKWQYGRGAEKFNQEKGDRRASIATLDGPAAAAAEADYRVWLQENDKPVKIGGYTFPSYVRTSHVLKDEEERAHAVRSASTGAWSSADPVDRAIVGKPATREIMDGWAILRQVQAEEEAARAPGEAAPTGRERALAEWIGAKVPGFMRDYNFSKRSVAERLIEMKPIVKSKYASEWHDMLSAVISWKKDYENKGYNKSQISETWKRSVAGELRDLIQGGPKGFQEEVKQFSQRTDEDGRVIDTKFIEGLISSGG